MIKKKKEKKEEKKKVSKNMNLDIECKSLGDIELILGNNKYIITKDVNEVQEHYLERINFIKNNYSNDNKINIELLITKSRIWRNITFLGMMYNNIS